jgi:chromosome segregation ATPase
MMTMRTTAQCLCLNIALATLSCGGSAALAQRAEPETTSTPRANATSSGPTLIELQTRLKRAQSDGELEPAVKQRVVELYQSAIERIEIAGEEAAKAKAFTERTASVPEKLRQAKERLAKAPEQSTLTVANALAAAGGDVEKLEQMLSDRRKLIDDPEKGLQARVTSIEKELAAQMPRLQEIAADLAEVEERLSTLEDELTAAAPPDEPREVTHARQSLLLGRCARRKNVPL